jgi:hypothetical protein
MLSGALTGVASSAFFQPIDKALYHATLHHRSLWHWQNFHAPYHGFAQNILQKTVQTGSYYSLQSFAYPLKNLLSKHTTLPENQVNIIYGSSIGLVNATINHPMAMIRFKQWSTPNSSYMQLAYSIAHNYGAKGFLCGIQATIARDLLFGAIYEPTRQALRRRPIFEGHSFFADTCAGTIAVMSSAPFNYARNYIFHHSHKGQPPSIATAFKHLSNQLLQPKQSIFESGKILKNALQIGPASLRFALGMAFGQWIYDSCMLLFVTPHNRPPTP